MWKEILGRTLQISLDQIYTQITEILALFIEKVPILNSAMNRLLSNSYRRSIDSKINKIVVSHKVIRNGKASSIITRNSIRAPNQITAKDAQYIYNEKCYDLEIAPNPNAERRFIEQFLSSLLRKSIKIGALGLGTEATKAFLQVIWNQKQYVYLDLSMNRLADAGAFLLAQYIQTNPPMIHLDLKSNNITSDGSTSLFQAMEENNTLVSIDFSAVDGIDRNKIGTKGCQALASLLLQNEIISHLYLSMSGISADGCAFLSEALSKNTSLLHLDLSSNRFGTLGANNLFKEAYSLSSIETLNLAHNGITDSASASICRQIELSKSIKYLDFTDNGFSKILIKKLLHSMMNSQITTLLLSHNKINPHSSDTLYLILRDVPSLQVLDLSYNPLKDSCVSQIAEALTMNESLISLDLTDTAFTDESAIKFGEVIEMNNTLQKLVLDTNTITDISGIAIAQALAKNKTLTQLSLKSNELGDITAPHFINSMQQNNTILSIEIDYNNFSYRTHVQLANAIATHKKGIILNPTDIATRRIEQLKTDERHLFDVRENVQKQTETISQFEAEKSRRENLLQEMKDQREIDVMKLDKRLEEVKSEYEIIAEQRRNQLSDFNRVKHETETKQASALTKAQSSAAKRQHAETRLQRAQEKKEQVTMEKNRILDDLKLHLLSLKDQLRHVIEDANIEQQELIQKEEEEKLAKQAALLTEQGFAKKMGKKKAIVSARKSDTKNGTVLKSVIKKKKSVTPLIAPSVDTPNIFNE